MKKTFTEPEVEVLVFTVEDVITTSGGEFPGENETPDW